MYLHYLDPEQAVDQRLNNDNKPFNQEFMMLVTENLQEVILFALLFRHMHDVYDQEKLQ